MGSRLEIKHGLVAEPDRLSTSVDTLSVTEPATGSKARSKGNLYLLVSATVSGPRAREATALIADTIRREYYYDESAGVPICLEKAVKSANRRLRGSREGGGLPPGAVGLGMAVIRQNELYLATIGNVEAYLVRAARLLMPDRRVAPGLPADDSLKVDVWRGELSVGDSLLIVSRALTEVVGTEELKNAVVTLHPQSAVEHLHHLFVAANGEGSDAVIAVEASEPASRGERRAVAVGGDAYGDLPGGPLPEPVAGAASALTGALGSARHAVAGAIGGAVDRVMDVMPRRSTSTRRISPLVSQRESQRRAAVALLAFLGIILFLGVLVWVFPRGAERPVANVTAGEAAFASAQDKADRAGRLRGGDPEEALAVYQDAWRDVLRAREAGVPAETLAPLESSVRGALDDLHDTRNPTTKRILGLGEGADPIGLARGPDRAAYVLQHEARSVTRVDTRSGESVEVVSRGDGPGQGIGAPRLVGAGGPDVLITDVQGHLWRWRPSNAKGRGTLARVRLGGDVSWGDDIIDVGTFTTGSGGLYNLYVIDPSSKQILRYQPQADGGGFTAPTDYLVTSNEDVASFRGMLIDGDIYTLTSDNLVRHESGRIQGDFRLARPPDDGDLRPGHDYLLVDGQGSRGSGRVYVYDRKWGRILVFDKSDGRYLQQWVPGPGSPAMTDVRGMYIVPGRRSSDPVTVYWVNPEGLFETVLQQPRAGEG